MNLSQLIEAEDRKEALTLQQGLIDRLPDEFDVRLARGTGLSWANIKKEKGSLVLFVTCSKHPKFWVESYWTPPGSKVSWETVSNQHDCPIGIWKNGMTQEKRLDELASISCRLQKRKSDVS